MDHEFWSPDFIGIGAEKSATTWAWSMLNAHPRIAMSQPKELNYFNDNFHRGPAWYRSHFRDSVRRDSDPLAADSTGSDLRRTWPLHGEISPHYMDCPQAAARIADQYPNTRLLVMLRDPFDRALSHVLHDAQNAYGGVADVTAEQLTRLVQQDDKYIRRSCYAASLTPFLEHFPIHQIGIFFFDDVTVAPKRLVQHLYEFVGTDPEWIPDGLTTRVNRTQNYRSVTAARACQYASRAARAFAPTNAILQTVYRRTRLREQVLNLLMVDRGQPDFAPDLIFSPEQLARMEADLQQLTRFDISVPDAWRSAARRTAA